MRKINFPHTHSVYTFGIQRTKNIVRITCGTYLTEKQSRNFFKSKNLFSDRIAMHKFVWFKEILFESWKIFLWVTLLMYYVTAQEFISSIQWKKTIKEFLWIKETFLRPYSNAQICFIQRNFVWIKETFLRPCSKAQICLIQRNFIWIKETFFWLYRPVLVYFNYFHKFSTLYLIFQRNALTQINNAGEVGI